MKHVSRFISVILCICTVLACAVSVSAATYAKDAYGNEEECEAVNISLNTSAGIRLGINGEFMYVSVRLSTYLKTDTKATVKIYKWNKSYDETLESEPIASKTFNPVNDNQKHMLRFAKQQAGEYLILITNENSSLAVWKWKNNGVGHGYTYFDGSEEACDINVTVGFTSDVSDPFYAIESSESATGNSKAPDEYVPDENSAVVARASHPTTWAATDELGRTLPMYEETGGLREGKTVGLFYWSWHVTQAVGEPLNLQDFIEAHPEAQNDYDNPVWPTGATSYFWNESIYGYYKTNDKWVLRKHAELLADAGVDVIFFDNTNGTLTFKDSYTAIFQTFEKALEDGVNVPKISFILPFWDDECANTQVRAIYNDIYKRNKYQKLWFYFDGKPMLMCDRSFINAGDALGREIRSYFTYRKPQPSYTADSTVYNQWGWLSVYPQTKYKTTGKKGVEQMTVGVSLNHNYVTHQLTAMNGENVMGRTYTSKGIDTQPDAVKYGANFAEQFEYALEADPGVIFITGWNEWIVGRYDEWGGVTNAFPDEFNDEFSRDIEPSKGKLRDNYYYQMVSYIRRFKGCEQTYVHEANKTVNLNGSLSQQWNNVTSSFIAYAGNTEDRDARGYGSNYYTDSSGRNDIIEAKAVTDEDNVYFMVKCSGDITSYTDANWMNLYIDTDETNKGWETFDYVVGKKPASKDCAYLQRFTGNGYETSDAVEISYAVSGEYLVYAVPKSDIGLDTDSGRLCFKWTDNVQDEDGSGVFKGEILDFYRTGDAAPGGRFKYVYSYLLTEPEIVDPDTEEVTETEEATQTEEITETEEETEAEEITEPDEITEPEEITVPEEITETEEITEPEEITDTDETTKEEETAETGEITDEEETTGAEEVTEPDETTGPEDALHGDCNLDGEVNNKDVVALFRYVSGTERIDDERIYDFNEDNAVDNKDVVALFRFLSTAQ